MPTLGTTPKYSFIIPIYNEEESIAELYRRLTDVLEVLDGPSEIILVNDGSRDSSLEMMRQLHHRDRRIVYLSLARNFGHQIAVTAGLNFARGEAVIILDADLQDPPELVYSMIAEWQNGYQVVYAQRIQRHQESWFKRLMAYVFYRVLDRLANVRIPKDTGDFCLMDRVIVDLLNRMPERSRYIRGLRAWLGFKQTAVRFERPPRFAGEVKYTFKKSLALAINSLVAFSVLPLRLSTYLGLFAGSMAIVMAFLVLYWRIARPDSPLTGLATIMIAIFFWGQCS